MRTMTCPQPTCGGQLVELERSGVKIDACPTCRGVWLDRGELDKLIAQEARQPDVDDDFVRELTGGRSRRDDDDDDDDRRERERRYSSEPYRDPKHGSYPPKKKKRGFLSDMFEFGD
jgi:Zn-finger nucleic acid-binding protein